MTFAEAIARWLAYRAQLVNLNAIGDGTHRNQSKIAALWSSKIGHFPVGELRKSAIDVAVAELSITRAATTLQADVALLAQILNWCEDECFIDKRPRLPTVQVQQVDEELPSDEAFLWVLVNVSPPRHRDALEFMLLTGLAPHELERLLPIDFDVTRGEFGAIGIGQRPDFKIKTPARRRWVPLNRRAAEIWHKRAYGSEHAFPSVAAMEKAMQRARVGYTPDGVDQLTPKMMRKWFSSKLAGDVAEHVLQRLLGHRPGSKITRKHYVRSQQADMEGAVEGLEIPQGVEMP